MVNLKIVSLASTALQLLQLHCFRVVKNKKCESAYPFSAPLDDQDVKIILKWILKKLEWEGVDWLHMA
jgi:hypothetical protein